MRALAFIVLLGWSAVTAASAQSSAEDETGSHISIPRRARIVETAGLSDMDRGRITIAEFARCSVDRRSGEVRRMLSLPADKVEAGSFAKIADDECLSDGMLKFRPIVLRGALFTELYRRRTAADTRGQIWRLPVVLFDPTAAIDRANKDLVAQITLLNFASCVIDKDAANAKAVVMGPTVSKQQDSAFTALSPSFGSCVEKGQQITLTRMVLEGALSEVLYRGTANARASAVREAR